MSRISISVYHSFTEKYMTLLISVLQFLNAIYMDGTCFSLKFSKLTWEQYREFERLY